MKKVFEYEAIASSGEKVNGLFEGSSEGFETMVSQKKIIVLKVKEVSKKLNKSKFSSDDFLALIEELYYLTKSGMAIDQSIKMCMKTAEKESQVRVLKTVLEELKKGSQLSISLKNAFEKEKIPMDSLSVSFISTAEEVGDISNGLLQLFEYLSFQKKIKADTYQALAYPMFLVVMSVVVAFLIFFLIIPRFSTIFSPEEFEKLPAISHTVLSLGAFLNAHIMEFFIALFTSIGVAVFAFKSINIPMISIMYKVPKLSKIIIDLQLTIVYGAMSTMLKGGLELDKALRQMQKIKLLPELSDLLKNTLYELKRGQKLSTVFAISKIIPSSDIALLYVGENSASLDEICKSLSTRHSDAFSKNVKKFLSLLEPTVIVALGIFIAIIVVSIMMAVMSITDIAG